MADVNTEERHYPTHSILREMDLDEYVTEIRRRYSVPHFRRERNKALEPQ